MTKTELFNEVEALVTNLVKRSCCVSEVDKDQGKIDLINHYYHILFKDFIVNLIDESVDQVEIKALQINGGRCEDIEKCYELALEDFRDNISGFIFKDLVQLHIDRICEIIHSVVPVDPTVYKIELIKGRVYAVEIVNSFPCAS